MSKNLRLKQIAINMRMDGKTYSEILASVPVAKSTLSVWLHGVELSHKQRQKITEKKRQGMLKGALTNKKKRIIRQQEIIQSAKNEVDGISKRDLWLVGIALYWAEGSKEKEYKPGSRTSFTNSDPKMVAVFIKWLIECTHTQISDMKFSLYIHESHESRVDEIKNFWSKSLGIDRKHLESVYFKRNKPHTKRKNTGNLYNGLLRVNIKTSSTLNRKITGWIQGITHHCGIV